MGLWTRGIGRRIALICALGLASGLLLRPTEMAAQGSPPGILWSANHEAGTTVDWWSPAPARVEGGNCGGEYNSATTSSEITPLAYTGRYGLALRVPNLNTGDSLGARLFRWCESRQHQALYYSAWYFIPQPVAVDWWWQIMQWKSAGSVNAKFTLAVANRPDGRMYIGLGRGADSGGGFWGQSIKDLPVGQWVHLEAYYQKATDQTGRVTVWQDGVQIIDVAGVQTANSADLGWAVINYGQYTTPRDLTIYVDDAAISTARVGPSSGALAAAPPPLACSARPPIQVSAARGEPGRLEVQVTAPTSSGLQGNRLRELRFEETSNAQIDVRGRAGAAGGFSVELPDRPERVSFTVRRTDPARGTIVRLTAVDDCGPWPTFTGGGPGAF